jgi:hypothetical protein
VTDRDQAVIDSLDTQAMQATRAEGARRGHERPAELTPAEQRKPLTCENE